MHLPLTVIIISVLASTFVASAPALDAATLLKNGQAAQKLNAQFQNLNATNSCQSGETACIANAIATCNNGEFDTSSGPCEKTQSCFALPNVRTEGTILKCTSLNSALSLINATGATGGLTGDDSATSNEGSNSTASDSTGKMAQNPKNLSSVAASATAAEAPAIVTVTVTLTATAAPVTVEASTQTLSPEQASSLLLSILGQAAPATESSAPTASTFIASSPAVSTALSAAAIAATSVSSSDMQPTAAQTTESIPLFSTFAASTPEVSVTPTNIATTQISESVAPLSSPGAAAAVVTSSAASSASDGYDSGSYGGY